MVGFTEDDDSGELAVRSEAADEQVAHNEAILVGDDKLVKVALKIRDKIAEVTKEHEAAVKVLKEQLTMAQQEIIRRLQERGATQTKTQWGTAFIGENMTASIADDALFEAFVIEQKDVGYLQKRVKIERLREYMKAHDGRLPPGLSVFREVTLNMRKA